jgi:hypothetical protein
MFSLNFNIRNPWSNSFKNLWNRSYTTPFKNKFVELELYRYSYLMSFNINLSIRQSHAGLDLELGLLGYCAHFTFYDNRHWDHKTQNWE